MRPKEINSSAVKSRLFQTAPLPASRKSARFGLLGRLPGLIVAFVAILAGYWALMTFVPMSGIGVGSYAENANLANRIDAQYLPGRKWNGAGSFVNSSIRRPARGAFSPMPWGCC